MKDELIPRIFKNVLLTRRRQSAKNRGWGWGLYAKINLRQNKIFKIK
jgi:hypothetical protein